MVRTNLFGPGISLGLSSLAFRGHHTDLVITGRGMRSNAENRGSGHAWFSTSYHAACSRQQTMLQHSIKEENGRILPPREVWARKRIKYGLPGILSLGIWDVSLLLHFRWKKLIAPGEVDGLVTLLFFSSLSSFPVRRRSNSSKTSDSL